MKTEKVAKANEDLHVRILGVYATIAPRKGEPFKQIWIETVTGTKAGEEFMPVNPEGGQALRDAGLEEFLTQPFEFKGTVEEALEQLGLDALAVIRRGK